MCSKLVSAEDSEILKWCQAGYFKSFVLKCRKCESASLDKGYYSVIARKKSNDSRLKSK